MHRGLVSQVWLQAMGGTRTYGTNSIAIPSCQNNHLAIDTFFKLMTYIGSKNHAHKHTHAHTHTRTHTHTHTKPTFSNQPN